MNELNQAVVFPVAWRTLESGYTAHGRWFPDPYQWLEQLDDPEVLEWIAAQEALVNHRPILHKWFRQSCTIVGNSTQSVIVGNTAHFSDLLHIAWYPSHSIHSVWEELWLEGALLLWTCANYCATYKLPQISAPLAVPLASIVVP